MPKLLKVSVGQHSDRGRKDVNQDFHGVYIPQEPLLSTKGIAISLADGISSSQVSQVASEAAVRSFMEDYYCTSDAWSVKRSAQCVLNATNSWLYAQTQQSQYRYDKDRGYVCTLSAVVIKAATAHIFHIGDARIYRLHGHTLEQLTNDHRLWVSPDKSYLSRALGINRQLEIDYQALPIEKDDVFVLATDGVYDYATRQLMAKAIHEHKHDLNQAAKQIVGEAYARGSGDNLTVQIISIDELPDPNTPTLYRQLSDLPLPPTLEARMGFDGFRIIRELHASSRSHVHLAVDSDTNEQVVIKTPSIDLQADRAYLERFMLEEWIARRINSPYVLKPFSQTRKRNHLYIATEYIHGQTLHQWMLDNPRADLATVRDIVEQVAKGLRSFHRLEMLHQDLRPANVMIDNTGTAKIIDFGSTSVAGIAEAAVPTAQINMLGTAQYTAPEYFLGEAGRPQSDMFSLGVIAYQMLTGDLPYGTQVAKCRTRSAQNKLRYKSLLRDDRAIPPWIDGAIRKAVHPNPYKRYEDLSEFIYDLRHPNKSFVRGTRPPLVERNPVLFWQSICFILVVTVVVLLSR